MFIYLFIAYLFICLFVYLFTYLFVYLFVCLVVYLFICFICLFVCFIYFLFVYLFYLLSCLFICEDQSTKNFFRRANPNNRENMPKSRPLDKNREKFSRVIKNNTLFQKTRERTRATDPYWRLPSPPIVGEKYRCVPKIASPETILA